MQSENDILSMTQPAKIVLYFLALGIALLLGGIAYQIMVGVSTMSITDEPIERFGYLLMSRGSILLIVAYALVFFSGIAFWLLGPYTLKNDRWFLIAFLLFYVWLPVDLYTMSLDIRFALSFNPAMPLTNDQRYLFLSRQQSLGPIPLVMLLGYLIALGMMVFKPGSKTHRPTGS